MPIAGSLRFTAVYKLKFRLILAAGSDYAGAMRL